MIDEDLRERLRAAIDEKRPRDVARRTLELLGETALVPSAEAPGYRVVDREGATLTRPDGTPLALADLVDDMRARHPALFEVAASEPPRPVERARAVRAKLRDETAPRLAGEAGVRWRFLRDRVGPAPLIALATAIVLAFVIGSYVPAWRTPSRSSATIHRVAPARDPDSTSSVGRRVAASTPAAAAAGDGAASQASPAEPPAGATRAAPAAVLTGPAEVIDTATLKVGGRVAHLAGVEWVRGAESEDLTRYLAGRTVTCRPSSGPESYACEVAGRDLAEVVLYNGGARAAEDATPELAAAEDRARAKKVGVWRKDAAAR